MSNEELWCNVCQRLVAVGVEEIAAAVAAPMICAVGGGAVGAAKDGARGGLVGGALGLLLGAAVQALVSPTQRLVCGDCETHLA